MKIKITQELSNKTNDELKSLLIEIEIISSAYPPVSVKQSVPMKNLFKIVKTRYNDFMQRLNIIDSALRNEILNRFKNGKL